MMLDWNQSQQQVLAMVAEIGRRQGRARRKDAGAHRARRGVAIAVNAARRSSTPRAC
jgi:hypothetical protein